MVELISAQEARDRITKAEIAEYEAAYQLVAQSILDAVARYETELSLVVPLTSNNAIRLLGILQEKGYFTYHDDQDNYLELRW